jgi:hypothetical protein
MADNDTKTAEPNPLDTWRQFITDSERQWNGFFKEVLGTDAFSNSMNAWVEASLTVQRMIADQLERLYTTFNIPSHSDLVSLGERMKAIEDSLARLEASVAASSPNAVKPMRPRPPRTKRPPNANGLPAAKRASA